MARRVVSILRHASHAARAVEPALEANAYAIAEDVDLTLVLRADAVELAVAGAEPRRAELAGSPLPPAASAQDIRGLVESGVAVVVVADDARRAGLADVDFVTGVRTADAAAVASLLRHADAVIAW